MNEYIEREFPSLEGAKRLFGKLREIGTIIYFIIKFIYS
tara:strand:+ start:5418 stop:5534 length:117 start_codon:yes stop_codon:yes gene_type:complete